MWQLLSAVTADVQNQNMNGPYLLTKTADAPPGKGFPTNFGEYPGGAEFFDVYHGPIKTVYSQVWWKSIENKIPSDIVERFDGKVMAIVGIETDQVRKTPEGDVSVPITCAYNHHHDTAVIGKSTRLQKVHKDDPRAKAADPRKLIRLSHDRVWLPVEEGAPSKHGYPSSAWFTDGNGGEFRKTMHVYAPPFAQLVESPTSFTGAPMHIDTWHRDKMNLSTGVPFVAGPLPRHNLAPPDARYSGLLECPITSRIQKICNVGRCGWGDSFFAKTSDCPAPQPTCTHATANESTCFAAMRSLPGLGEASLRLTTASVHSSDAPPGCSLVVTKVNATDGRPLTASAVYNSNAHSTACCGAGVGGAIRGAAHSLVAVQLHLSSSTATITLEGPSDVWFAVGLNASSMRDAPYTIVVEADGHVSERRLQNHRPGIELASSVSVVSSTVQGATRTVVLTRPLKGATPRHYSFATTQLHIEFINALGSSPTFQPPHKAHTAAALHLWPLDGVAACVCTEPAKPFGAPGGQIK